MRHAEHAAHPSINATSLTFRLSPFHTMFENLKNRTRLSILIGKNGSGKSRLLRTIDEVANRDRSKYWVRYISPERGGTLKRDGSVLTNIEQNKDWMIHTRRTNQSSQFKQISAHFLNELEVAFLRKIETDIKVRADASVTFSSQILNRINRLLFNIELKRAGSGYVFETIDGDVVTADAISSGESEAICLGTEILYFFNTLADGQENILLIDEPDVHMHPDMQARMGSLIVEQIDRAVEQKKCSVSVIVATHSTPLICSLLRSINASIGCKYTGVEQVVFLPPSEKISKLAPLIGHPLSQVLSADPALIVEGEDDERVWQQAVRTAKGRFRFFPISVGTVSEQSETENAFAGLLSSLYDDPIVISIRDGDGRTEPLVHNGIVKRFRLACYSIENILLTDDVLGEFNVTWVEFCARIDQWIKENGLREECASLRNIVQSADRLRHSKIKDVRNILVELLGTRKPWEVVVGQAIGRFTEVSPSGESSLREHIGAGLQMLLCPSSLNATKTVEVQMSVSPTDNPPQVGDTV